MIEDVYVSFETAKLLKEKGFDGRCYKVWEKCDGSEPTIIAAPIFVEGETTVTRESVDSAAKYMMNIYSLHNRVDGYLAPTLQMAMRWLREVHNLKPGIWYSSDDDDWKGEVFTSGEYVFIGNFISYEEATEEVIKYCLETLIK